MNKTPKQILQHAKTQGLTKSRKDKIVHWKVPGIPPKLLQEIEKNKITNLQVPAHVAEWKWGVIIEEVNDPLPNFTGTIIEDHHQIWLLKGTIIKYIGEIDKEKGKIQGYFPVKFTELNDYTNTEYAMGGRQAVMIINLNNSTYRYGTRW